MKGPFNCITNPQKNYLSLNSLQLHLHPVIGIGTFPNHDILVGEQGKGTVKLQEIHPVKDIVVKITAEITALMNSQFKLVPPPAYRWNIHPSSQ